MTEQRFDPSHELLLALSRATAAHVGSDPERAFAEARRRLDWQLEREPHSAGLIDAWRDLMDSGAAAVIKTLMASDAKSVSLQSCSPFRFLLSDEERDRIIAGFDPS